MIPFLGLICGLIIGLFLPFDIPTEYSVYVAVGVFVALDSLFEALIASKEGRFSIKAFFVSFFGNGVLAALLTFMGEKTGLPLYLAPIFALGVRVFESFATIRRMLVEKYSKKNIK